MFPFWAIVFSLLAWVQPSLFIPFKSWIVPLLAVVMFAYRYNREKISVAERRVVGAK